MAGLAAPCPGLHLAGDLVLQDKVLVRGLDITCPAGGWSVLLGRSGIGKSSLARIVAGLPCAVRLTGKVEASDALPVAGRVTLMGQTDQLLPWDSVLDNICLGARLRGTRPDRSRAMDLLAQVGLQDHAHHRPATLSGGQRQRVALARTLMEDRAVVVLDEPFSALDAATRAAMQDLAHRLLQGCCVILITHDPLEAARLAERCYLVEPAGVVPLDLPAAPPPRALSDPAILAAQARLYRHLLTGTQA